MNDGRTGDPGNPREGDLSELRSRLEALHGSVERLGREDAPPQGRPAYPQQPAPPVPGPASQPPYAAPQQPAYDPYAPAPVPDPAGAPAYGYEYEQGYAGAPVDPYAPAPAATNGQGEAELAAGAAHLAILDVGPFADLIELRHFEEAVGRLEAVSDVRVRRFGHRRAMIELGLGGPYAIGRELYRLGRPMQVEPGPEGEIIVDFTDVPDVEAEAAGTAAGATQTEPAEPTPAAEAVGTDAETAAGGGTGASGTGTSGTGTSGTSGTSGGATV